jgi:hypothetical protein
MSIPSRQRMVSVLIPVTANQGIRRYNPSCVTVQYGKVSCMNRSWLRSAILVLVSVLVFASLATSALAEPAIGPRMRVSHSTSLNWSGYACETSLTAPANGVVTDVVGTWQVPFVTGSINAWSSAWVGVDGYSSSTVEQIGTDQDTAVSRRGVVSKSYYAWYEMYPAGSRLISNFGVYPGNIITAEVKYSGSNRYLLKITNVSTGKTFQTTQGLASAKRSSAEWIMEAPSSGSGILPLANFGTVNFSACKATINGTTGPISTWPYDPLTMVTGGSNSVARDSITTLTAGGTAFSATWLHN